ncbi:hypothetical protein CEXT_544071 [Caerostris extrusa]|uniref:Uncharacterized protein n=1 Tax=Caerostris extrusa TaxID=172846 RepID=A0AAV4SLW6_CAEEX|nr:hypothetical protein CEXT_544071 [Caerostris extrusa]
MERKAIHLALPPPTVVFHNISLGCLAFKQLYLSPFLIHIFPRPFRSAELGIAADSSWPQPLLSRGIFVVDSACKVDERSYHGNTFSYPTDKTLSKVYAPLTKGLSLEELFWDTYSRGPILSLHLHFQPHWLPSQFILGLCKPSHWRRYFLGRRDP